MKNVICYCFGNNKHNNNTAVWVCQGELDEVCPAGFARKLVEALHDANVPTKAHFLEHAAHETWNKEMED